MDPTRDERIRKESEMIQNANTNEIIDKLQSYELSPGKRLFSQVVKDDKAPVQPATPALNGQSSKHSIFPRQSHMGSNAAVRQKEQLNRKPKSSQVPLPTPSPTVPSGVNKNFPPWAPAKAPLKATDRHSKYPEQRGID